MGDLAGMTRRLLLAGLGLVTGLLAVVFVLASNTADDTVSESALLADPWPAPALVLTGPEGDDVALRDLRGGYVALFFGYTHCPDVCPIALAQLARLQARLDPEAERLHLVFVTVDPARDTAERLAAWTGAFQAPVLSLSGTVQEVREAAWAWGIGVHYRDLDTGTTADTPPDSGDYLVDHTARTFIVDPEGRVVAQLPPEADGRQLEAVLHEVLR